MTETGATRKRKWLRSSLIVGVTLVVVTVGAGLSGWPQKRVAEWAIERSTGMIAEVKWGGALPDLRVTNLYLYPDRAAQRRRKPLVYAYGIRVRYDLLARGRKVRKLDVGELLIDFDPDDPVLRDLPIFKSAPSERAAPSDSTYLPNEIDIQGAAIKMHRIDGTFLLADQVSVKIGLTNPESAEFAVREKSERIVLDAGNAHVRLCEVDWDGSGRYEGGTLTWSQTLENRGVFRLAFHVEGPLVGNDAHLDVKVDEASLKGDGLPAFLESLAAPIRFSEFTTESATAHISLDKTRTVNVSVGARISAPGFRGAAEPLYRDALRIAMTAKSGDTLNAEATVAFPKGQIARALLHGDADAGEVSAKVEGWSRAQFEDALPVAFRESVSGLGFDSFSSDAAVKWTKTAYEVNARAESKGGSAEAPPIAWVVQARGVRDRSQGVEGTAEARLGDRHVCATARYDSAERYLAEAVIEEVEVAPWIQLFAGKDTAALFDGTIEGTLRAEAKGNGAPIEIHPDLKLKNFVYDALKLDEITAKGSFRYGQADGRIIVDELRAEAPDGMTGVVLSGWDYDVKARMGGGSFALNADLGIIAKAMGDDRLYGAGAVEGKVRLDGSKMDAEFGCSSNTLNYGKLQMPYGVKLTGGGGVFYDRNSRRGELRGWHAALGDGTALRLASGKFSMDPLAAEGELVSESDLQILVAMGWLASVQGSLSQRTKVHFGNDTLHADWDLRIVAPKLELAEQVAAAEGIEFEGAGAYERGLSGTGRVRAAKIMAAGGSILDVSGPVLFDHDLMRVQHAKGELFRGAAHADIDVGVLTENFPITLSGTFEDVDLAVLTDEVKPPKAELTGKARGTISAQYSMDGLSVFTLESEAPTGLSVNRSLVEQLLQSDTFLSGAGANVAEKAMDKLIGTAPQRPFDRGRLTVQLANEKITGLAVLESQITKEYHGLNLRVTLDMDQSALAEALKMLQQSSVASVN